MPALLASVLVLAALLLPGCPASVDTGVPPANDKPRASIARAPLRRLTGEELNRTLRDLFAPIAVPAVVVTENNGKEFEGEASRQVASDLLVEQLRSGANDVAAAVVARRDQLLPRTPASVQDEEAVVREFLQRLLPRAFRRPVEDDELARYQSFFVERRNEDGFEVALRLVLQAVLQAPSLLYRLELDGSVEGDRIPVRGHEMATRLSYFLWGTMPDDDLRAAADDGSLDRVDGLTRRARAMLADPRARDVVTSFHRQWLELDRVLTANKDAGRFPAYNDGLRTSMRKEADLFIAEVFAGDAKLRTLLTSTTTRVDASLAALYGVPAPTRDWDLVSLPPNERAGILTQAQFLAGHAHAVEGSPVLRGVFVLERLLCQAPPPPAAGVNITPPDANEDEGVARTNRQRYERHLDQASCASCHAPIDGIGMGLENYDAIGAFRTTDNGFPVDASGTLAPTGTGDAFAGGVGLGQALASNEAVQRCVVAHWFRFAHGRHETQEESTDFEAVVSTFAAVDGDLRELLVAIVASDAFRYRSVP